MILYCNSILPLGTPESLSGSMRVHEGPWEYNTEVQKIFCDFNIACAILVWRGAPFQGPHMDPSL